MLNTKFNPQIHHRRSIRLKNYNYASDGAYFITICAKNRQHFFGEIQNGKMILNECGKIIANEWINTKNIRKNVKLGEFIIMPNHIHGILIINNTIVGAYCNTPVRLCNTPVHTRNTPQSNCCNAFGAFKSPSNNLGAIIRGFKSAATKQINQIQVMAHGNTPLPFQWQRNYYERVIRNENELNRIRKYIIENPEKWESDRNNPENLYM